MLRFLRKKENVKKIMWTLAILIIPAFILWGSGSAIRSKDQPKYAGKIFGKKISFPQYRASLLACRNQALLIYGDDFNKVAKYLDLEKEAWQRLILLHQAKKEKIKVTDLEVINFIQKLPFFQSQGRFQQERYNTLLDYVFRVSPREFEEQIREMLMLNKLKNKVINALRLSEEEIEKAYKLENEKARAVYVFFDPEKFTEQIHPSFEELKAYYQKHKAEFTRPEQVNVQYVALYFEQDAPPVNITTEEVQNYYQEHPEQFRIKDTKEEKLKPLAEVKEQIEERLKQNKVKQLLEDKIWEVSYAIAQEAATLESVAEKFQLEIKETGFFGPQQVIPEIGLSYEFLNAAFTLEPGEISEVIETPKGFFIIRIKEKKPPTPAELDEIKEEVTARVIREKSWKLAKNNAKELRSQIEKLMQEENLTFSQALKRLSLTAQETEAFSRSSYISGIGKSQEFTQAAFSLKVGQLSEIIPVPNGYCILSLKEIIPIDEEKFAQEKEEFARRLLARKKEIYYQAWLANLKERANLESNLEKLKPKHTP